MLSSELIKKNLKRIGRDPVTLQHVLLELTLSNCSLENISAVTEYPHVMFLDLSSNSITELSVLSSLPTLSELKASRNKITDCLGFAAPHCSFEGAWVKGHNSAGSLLTVADLSENNIEHMGDLSRHRFLEQLILHQNCISVMEGMQGLKYLRVLNLSYNNISVIEGLDNLPIKELHLKGNKIKQLHGLDKLPHLTLLDVSENSIISLSQLEQCNNLVHLDVSFNCIEYIRQVEYLQNIPWLTSLVLCNNPCEAKELYRLRVLYRLPKLLFLDNSEAVREDKVRAFNLYHSVDGDLSLREDVLRQYLPQVSFVDHSPQQLPHDEELDVTAAELLRGLPLSQENAEIEINPDSAFLPSVQELATLEEEEESVSDSVVEAVAAVMAKLAQSNNKDEENYRSVSFAGAAAGISFDNNDS